jgi:hypothetical protein
MGRRPADRVRVLAAAVRIKGALRGGVAAGLRLVLGQPPARLRRPQFRLVVREEAAARAVGALVAVDAHARLVLPLLLEGLRLGVAGPRVGLGEREGREVRRQRRERVRVLLVGRGRGSLKPSRVGGARVQS